jgi:two-component system, cell cycle response regulator
LSSTRRGAFPSIGASGLPNVSDSDADDESTRRTETNVVEPISSTRQARSFLMVVAGEDAGRLVPFSGEEIVIGRATSCGLVLPDPGVSRRHARIARRGMSFVLEDLESKNGTFVDGADVVSRELRPGESFQIGPSALVRLSIMTEEETRLAIQLYESSVRDPLTQVYNRRYFLERLRSELAYASRHGSELSVVAFDFDHFKHLNDTHGHPAGDAVLTAGARCALTTLRAEDVLARVGGEEFAVLLRGIGPEAALACAERVRTAIAGVRTKSAMGEIAPTVSLGVATTSELGGAPTADKLLQEADRRLYAAKRTGRNRAFGRGSDERCGA